MPIRLKAPGHVDLPSIRHSDQDSADEAQRADDVVPEEDVQSMIGLTISHTQTRLLSPKTPAAEKAAAFEDIDLTGLYDGAVASRPKDEDMSNGQNSPLKLNKAEVGVGERPQRKRSDTSDRALRALPSPWTASPKLFEIPHPQRRERASSKAWTSPAGILADLNVKRFMSSFNLPSLPKTTTFRDLSMPSMASILGGKPEDHSYDAATRETKASSDLLFKSQWASGKRSSPSRTPHRRQGEDQASNVLYGAPGNQPQSAKPISPDIQPVAGQSTDLSEEATSIAANHSDTLTTTPLVLRRSTSDQSIALRRVISAGSSLGDDSRWEGVQEQVNSRMKAIKDSLQDSSIKLPSIPNLANLNLNLNLNSLRPEFFRPRGSSDPNQRSGNNNTLHVAQANVANSKTDFKQRTAYTTEDNLRNKSSKSMHPNLDEALEKLTGDLVVMGGYRGSILRSTKPPYRQLWAPVKVGLNIRKVNLEVGLESEDEENMHESIFASGMLSHIGPVDMGRRLLRRIRDSPNCQNGTLRLHDYGWDWRLSPHLLSRKLVSFLEQLPCNAEGTPAHQRGATVIAHSMGGLITRHAVNQRPELFAGVVYAGVPQYCVNILGPLRHGDEVLLSSKVLTAQVNFSLRTSFLLLPEDGKCFIDKKSKEAYPVDFFDVESWKTYAFSPCIAPSYPPISQTERKGIIGTVYNSLPSLPAPLKRITPPTLTNPSLGIAQDAPTINTSSLSTSPPNPSTHSTIPLPLALTYLTRTLAATLIFKHDLAHHLPHSTQNRYPPLSILFSTCVPTVSAARVSSRSAIRCADAYDDLQFASGDGVCLAKAAQLPDGYVAAEGGRVKSERGHVGLLGDLEGVGRCLVAVGRARGRGVGLGVEEGG